MNGSFIFVGAILLGIGLGKLFGWDNDVAWLIAAGAGFLLWGVLGGRGFMDVNTSRRRRRRDD